MLSDQELRATLTRARTIAVVGLSENPYRDSHGIASFLQRHGYKVLPVNPNLRGPVLGEQPYASLRDIGEHIDIVDIFRRPEFVPEVIADAIAIGADVVWMQPGAVHEGAARQAEQAGLGVVAGRCIATERSRMRWDVAKDV